MSFDQLAVLSFNGDDEEKVIEAMFAADVAVEEVECEGGTVTIFAPPAEFYKARTAMLEAFPGLDLEIQEIRFLPQESKSLSGEDLGLFEKLLGMLNDSDDVQGIYHNIVIAS
jgi:transcriptional/translational regulatory protein YebC/TACO1